MDISNVLFIDLIVCNYIIFDNFKLNTATFYPSYKQKLLLLMSTRRQLKIRLYI